MLQYWQIGTLPVIQVQDFGAFVAYELRGSFGRLGFLLISLGIYSFKLALLKFTDRYAISGIGHHASGQYYHIHVDNDTFTD